MTSDAKFNGDWKTESLELRDELAAYKNAPVVAYATTNEYSDLSMLFFDEQEARKYSGDDEPIKLIVKPRGCPCE